MVDDLTRFSPGYLVTSPRERSIATNWISIKAAIKKAIVDHTLHKKACVRFNLPYMTNEIKRKINRRKRVHKKAAKFKRRADREMCKRLRKEINNDLDMAYNRYIHGILVSEKDKPGAL